jgi:hypothetical protein
MKTTITLLLVLFCLGSAPVISAQETKYAYGVVDGGATIYKRWTNFYYFTTIDRVDCPVSRRGAEQQLKKAFRRITSRWKESGFRVYFFNSFEDAKRAKAKYVRSVKATRSRSFDTKLADANIRFNFTCTN